MMISLRFKLYALAVILMCGISIIFSTRAWSELHHNEIIELYTQAINSSAEKHNGAFAKLLREAKNGDDFAQMTIGNLYLAGQGVAKDYNQALRWLKAAANQENAQAQTNLGVMYDKGEGVKQDKKQAAYWYTKAAQQGFAQAQFNLGLLYESGDGVEQNQRYAFILFKKAARKGLQQAQMKLASLPKDYYVDNFKHPVQQNALNHSQFDVDNLKTEQVINQLNYLPLRIILLTTLRIITLIPLSIILNMSNLHLSWLNQKNKMLIHP